MKLPQVLAGADVADVGLVLVAIGLSMISVAAALIVVGAILILQKRPLRSWF